jgi:hypothetical protein
MDGMPVSEDLIAWAKDAGFDVAQDGSTETIMSNKGGEERFFVRPMPDRPGWYAVTNASRAEDETFLFVASGLEVVERYFWGFFGGVMRSRLGMRRLPVPIAAEQVSPPYRIESASGSTQLIAANGDLVMGAQGDITDVGMLVRTSHWLAAQLPLLKQTYRDPNGRPLIPLKDGE